MTIQRLLWTDIWTAIGVSTCIQAHKLRSARYINKSLYALTSIYTSGMLKNSYSSPSFPQSGTREWIKCSLLYVYNFFLLSVVWQLGCHSKLWSSQCFLMASSWRIWWNQGDILAWCLLLIFLLLLLTWTGCVSRCQNTVCLNSSYEGRSFSCFLQKVTQAQHFSFV